ncbi:MAG: HNH endonuclease [Propionivibrio sp.]|jgi:hypothetical protein|nr:HNH endonuclease [Propionivibrio sp.]
MTRKLWTEDEISVLRELYPHTRAKDIADRLGCTTSQVLEKAWRLGLKKSREAIARMARAAMENPAHPCRKTQFKAGLAPWNKGTHYQAGGRSAETQFKAGNRSGRASILWMPIGSERVRTDGYLERKLYDTGVTRRDFVCIHHIVWREAGREIPPGHVLVFKDGNNRNFDLDNLEAINRSDLMRRNSIHNYGPEIARLHQLQGAITRQINKRIGKSERKQA